MAKIRVKYTVTATQYIDWPDDEMGDFNYDNLESNLDATNLSTLLEVDDILEVEVNNEPHEF